MELSVSHKTHNSNPADGAENLLLQCLRVTQGESLLLVLEEDESLYSLEVGRIVEAKCHELGVKVTVLTEPLINHAADFPLSVANLMRTSDHTLFLSRLGDYVRFVELPGSGTKTTSYTFSAEQLDSPYAALSHTLLAQLRDKLERELLAASTWQISCPLGTDLNGSFDWPSLQGGDDDEILVALYPVSTFKPIPCHTANGSVALSRWLMPGGAPKIDSPGLNLSETVHCEISQGTIQRFFGSAKEADRVSKHYDRVASTLGINRNRVHSWHLGINPQTYFATAPELDFERWCSMSFASPRYLHFHTCGDDPPGEIAWSLFNCTVHIDDEIFWKDGEFSWLNRMDNREIISRYSGAEILLQPSRSIGV